MRLTGNEFNKQCFVSWIEPHISDDVLVKRLKEHMSLSPYMAGIAVNNHQIPVAAQVLKDTDIMVVGTVAYPLGGLPLELKCAQIQELCDQGADQIDIVMGIESILAGDDEAVKYEIEKVMKIKTKARLCLIPNLDWLERSRQICIAAMISQTQKLLLRSTTGYGVTTKLETIQNLRNEIGSELEILVSGGCETPEAALYFLTAGANGFYVDDLFSFIHRFQTLTNFQKNQEEK